MGEITNRIAELETENSALKNELLRLKWIVTNLMQRFGKDMVLLHMDNPVQMGISIHEQPEKRIIDVRMKKIIPESADVPATGGEPTVN